MKIKLKEITVRELVAGYKDSGDEGVVGYGGKLDIRPPYQREFIYEGKQKEAVIDTLTKNFPLNVMYWAVREDGNYEIIDGQQRTISICQYRNNEFSFAFPSDKKNPLPYDSLQKDQQEQILNYKLMVYFCSGSDSEKLEWFKTINIAGEELTDQELRNAIYHGSWVTNAKRYFSKKGGPAYGVGGNYLNGSANRQDYLETAIKWISNNKIVDYMTKNQQKSSAKDLWDYFCKVIEWVQKIFPKYRKEMKGLPWGFLYNDYKDKKFDAKKLEDQVKELMKDEDVIKKSGIYQYVLTSDEKYLNIRTFTESQKRTAYEKQEGICVKCKEHFEMKEMEADHINPWSKGGDTTPDNCQMLCLECNRRKSNK